MNTVVLTGRLTRDAELRDVGENKVARFGVAVDGFKKDETHFFDCEAWGKTGEFIAQHFPKGKFIILRGRLKQETWEKDGQKNSRVLVVAEEANFGPKVEGGGGDAKPADSGKPAGKASGKSGGKPAASDDEDDVMF